MAKKTTKRGKRSGSGKGPIRRGKRSASGKGPIEIAKVTWFRRFLGILYCCSGVGDWPTGGPHIGITARWADVTESPPDYISVAKAIAKLFPVTPTEIEGVPCLALSDGRRVLLEPKGVFKILQSEADKEPVTSRKAIGAVMLLKGWPFEQTVAWMKETFGAEAARNTARDYIALLVSEDR